MKIRITKGNKMKYITMYDFNYNQFFKFMDENTGIRKQFEKHMKLDLLTQENIIFKESIIELWKRNKKLKELKTRFCILIHNKNYVGSFRYYKRKISEWIGVDLSSKVYIHISVVYIVPLYRKLGIAYKMLKKIIDNKNRYALRVDKNNIGAIKLYKKLGFKNMGGNDEDFIFVK